jgi:hypothetical protein
VAIFGEDERHPPPAFFQLRVVQSRLDTLPNFVDLVVEEVHIDENIRVAAGVVAHVVDMAA